MIQARLNTLGLGWAELIGLLTSFLFITGLSYFYGYYNAGLNAGWIINLLTSKELLISNLRLGVVIIMVFMYLESIFDKDSGNKLIKEFLWGCVAITGILVYFFIKKGVWIEGAGYLIALIAIFGLVKWDGAGKWICILLILFIVPYINGITAFQNKVRSNLPEVTLKNEDKQWLLFDTFSDKVVLIDGLKKDKNIRVVSINDLENVRVK
jgi:hypothetical protein